MIEKVTLGGTPYAAVPSRSEAGTPAIAEVIGLRAAVDYVSTNGMENIAAWEHELLEYATERLSGIAGIRFIGTAGNKASVVSFIIDAIHPYDVGVILDQLGIAVRTGHHCTQPLMDYYGIPGTVRASFAFYNTREEIDILTEALHKAVSMLA